MENERAIEVLNKLVTINNDRLEGYETASRETEEHDLLTFFSELSKTSAKCREQLVGEILDMGGEQSESTKITGKFFRAWMDVRVAISNKDRRAILTSCEYGEDSALAAYEDVMDNDFDELSPEQKAMVNAQYDLLTKDHDKVRAMRDAAIKAA